MTNIFYEDLLANSNVQALILELEDNSVNLQSTWQLIEDMTDLEKYDVRLLNVNGEVIQQQDKDIDRYFTGFSDVTEGLYTVCVAVVAADARSSDVCSYDVEVVLGEEGEFCRLPEKVYNVLLKKMIL